MIEALWGILVFILRTVSFVLEMMVFVVDAGEVRRCLTGSTERVKVPKIPSPAAQRALDEAEQRRLQAANGTVQAS
jgi:hypothetical protein